jgi:lipopolysaccharide biosynthesis regulator YciM
MFDPFILIVWLLPLAAIGGWYVARHDRNQPSASQHGRISADYLRGLNHLVNDDPDRAIEVFVRVLDVDNDTVETHMALGNLFRRRGEMERALHWQCPRCERWSAMLPLKDLVQTAR